MAQIEHELSNHAAMSNSSRTRKFSHQKKSATTVKILVIGNPNVGKTSFVARYVDGQFQEKTRTTIGVDYASKDIEWTDGRLLRIQLWDVAGQETTTTLSSVYYRHAHGCLLLFDLTDRQSFLDVVKWKREFDRKCQTGGGYSIPIVLVGNKCDCKPGLWKVTSNDLALLCEQFFFDKWIEISVKTNQQVQETVTLLLQIIFNQLPEEDQPTAADPKKPRLDSLRLESFAKSFEEDPKEYLKRRREASASCYGNPDSCAVL